MLWQRRASVPLALCLAAVALLQAPATALACSCVQRTPEQLYQRAATVFHGRAVAVEPSPVDPNLLRTRFEPVRVFRGEAATEIVVDAGREPSLCGYRFEPGREYLVFGDGAGSVVTTSVCSGTALYTGEPYPDYFSSSPAPVGATTATPCAGS